MNSGFHMIAAATPDGGIGRNGKLILKDPLDMAWFYNITLGHTVIMGRKTYESIGPDGLVNRQNIVLSTTLGEAPNPDVIVVDSVKDLLWLFLHENYTADDAYVIGGGMIYRLLMPYAKYIHLTTFLRPLGDTPTPDTYFPKIDMDQWRLTSSVSTAGSTPEPYLRFETFVRKE